MNDETSNLKGWTLRVGTKDKREKTKISYESLTKKLGSKIQSIQTQSF